MNKLNRILAGVSFLASFIIYIMTMAPTTSFWDCGEFIATAFTMGVPHPPGTPLYLILGNVFSQLPFFNDIGARVNLLSPLASAFSVMFLYLIIVELIIEWRGKVQSKSDAIIAYASAFIGAMTFAFTDSHWFNAVEAEVYSLSTFFTGIVVWLILRWSRNEGKPGNVRYILLIAYMLGLAIGIHLLNLLALPFIALIIYFKKYTFSPLGFSATVGATLLSFMVIYLGIIKGLPNITSSYGLPTAIMMVVSVFAITIWLIYTKNFMLSTIMSCLLMIFIGYSTYTTIFIRANQHPSINENNPDTYERALSYMNREQYGDWSITDRGATLQRPENAHWSRYTDNRNNPSDSDVVGFVWNYQVKEMYLRYFAWQFAGRGENNWDVRTKDGKLIKKLDGINWFRYGLPLALLFGLAGLGHHFYRDRKSALAVLAIFAATGIMIILYLNQYDPQPRERDYSYVGSFFTFSIWIGIGIAGMFERIREYFEDSELSTNIMIGVSVVLLVAMPINMMAKDYTEHSRDGNYVAWDYAYNMLNSCEPNGIIFTNGDNDTFPLWYIQEVEGVRKDVRVVNLSLLNTPWYIDQLKNEEPKLPIKNLSDKAISKIDPVNGTAYALQKWTPIWGQLVEMLDNKTRVQYGVKYSVKEFGIPVNWGEPEAQLKVGNDIISFNLKATLSNYIRVQDLMVLKLIEDIIDTHPVYFAVTVSPSNRMGLENYLSMEGLVYKVHTTKQSTGDSPPKLNYDKMLQNITKSPDLDRIIRTGDEYSDYVASGNGVYRYTNLDNADVYFSSNIVRLIQNYRSSFLQMALNDLYSNKENHLETAHQLLVNMESYFPQSVIPISEPDLEIQIARIYGQTGDIEMQKSILNKILNRGNTSLATQFYIGQVFTMDLKDFESAITLYLGMLEKYPEVPDVLLALMQTYAQADRIDEAIDFLNGWLENNPLDSKARELLELLKEQV